MTARCCGLICLLISAVHAMAAPMQTATRTTGVAPLAVFFDAVRTDSDVVQPTNRDHTSFHYRWNFGDATVGQWETNGADRNEASGPLAAHVFEQPGTYIVTLEVTDAQARTHVYEQTIRVTTFNGVTHYVSSTEGSDSNDSLSPQQAVQSFAKAMSFLAPNHRILFKRGGAWTSNASIDMNVAGPGVIGAYANTDGSDNPSLPKPRINHTSTGSLFRFGSSGVDWRIMDLDCTGPGGSSTGYVIEGNKAMRQMLALRLDATRFKSAFSCSIITNDHDQNFFVDCAVHHTDNKAAFIGGSRSAVLGCSMTDAGSHVLRVWHARKFIISNNILIDPEASGKASLKLHNHPGLSPASEDIIVSGNTFQGDQWPVTLGPQSASFNELIQRVLFERNRVTVQSNGRGLRGMMLFGPDMTVRNNVFNGAGSSGDPYVAIGIEPRGNGPMPHRARVYNNTVYRNDGRVTLCDIAGGVDGVVVRNNLIAVPSDRVSASTDVQGNAVTSKNLRVAFNDLFVAPESQDFRLLDGGLPIDAGDVAAVVHEDFLRQVRPTDGNGDQLPVLDVGAYESNGEISAVRPAALTSHVDGATLDDTRVTFVWTSGVGVEEYWLRVGSFFQGDDYFNASTGLLRSKAVDGLPSDGSDVFVQVHSRIGEQWLIARYRLEACDACDEPVVLEPAHITSPANGATFTNTSVTFQWSPALGATAYWLRVGSTQGDDDISDQNVGNVLAATVDTLRHDGGPIHVRLYTRINNEWPYRDYQYTACTGCGSTGGGDNANIAQLTTPSPGSTLDSNTATFQWTAATGASAYWLRIGTTFNGKDIFDGDVGTALSRTISSLGVNGGTVYVRLYSKIGGAWPSNNYELTACSGCGSGGGSTADSVASVISPVNGVTFTSDKVRFEWSAIAGASAYWLRIGSTPGGKELFDGNVGVSTSRTVSFLPTNGNPVYVTLYTQLGADNWPYREFNYVACDGCESESFTRITTPTPDSTLTSTSVLFEWTAAVGATEYWLRIGSTSGAKDIFDGNVGPVLSRRVSNLPSDGGPVHVRLYAKMGTNWPFRDFTFNACQGCNP